MFDAARRWLGAVCAAWAVMPHPCGAAQQASARELASDPCARPPVGSAVSDPAELRSSDGVLSLELSVRNHREADGSIRYCYVTAAGQQSPTLRMRPGDLLVLKLKNELVDLGATTAAGPAMPAHVHAAPPPVAGQDPCTSASMSLTADEPALSWLDRAAGLPSGRGAQDLDRGGRATL